MPQGAAKTLCAALLVASKAAGPFALLYAGSASSYRALFRAALNACRLDPLDFKPYSLRRGGATEHFVRSRCVQDTMLRGRWNSFQAAKIYIVDGQRALAEQQISDVAQGLCRGFAGQLHWLLDQGRP